MRGHRLDNTAARLSERDQTPEFMSVGVLSNVFQDSISNSRSWSLDAASLTSLYGPTESRPHNTRQWTLNALARGVDHRYTGNPLSLRHRLQCGGTSLRHPLSWTLPDARPEFFSLASRIRSSVISNESILRTHYSHCWKKSSGSYSRAAKRADVAFPRFSKDVPHELHCRQLELPGGPPASDSVYEISSITSSRTAQ